MEQVKKRLNLPETKLPIKPLTLEELEESADKRVSLISKEFSKGFSFIRNYTKSVTFFGSSKMDETSKYYKPVKSLAKKISEELGYTIFTGGGPGLMEAANRGAYEAGGNSVGISIKLPHEQALNPYLTDHINFYYFFSRKVCLTFSAEAFVFAPGGFGTFDELFEILTLLQTNKVDRVPVILFGKDFWKPFDDFLANHLGKKFKTIDPKDTGIYTLEDDENKIVEIIKRSPIRNGIKYHYGKAFLS